jgi:hypothetical protein
MSTPLIELRLLLVMKKKRQGKKKSQRCLLPRGVGSALACAKSALFAKRPVGEAVG